MSAGSKFFSFSQGIRVLDEFVEWNFFNEISGMLSLIYVCSFEAESRDFFAFEASS